MRTLLFLMSLGGVLHAAESRVCTARTIRGSYAYTLTATAPGGPYTRAPIVQGVGVGVRIFEGEGNFTQVVSIKGVNTRGIVDQPASGTYKPRKPGRTNGSGARRPAVAFEPVLAGLLPMDFPPPPRTFSGRQLTLR